MSDPLLEAWMLAPCRHSTVITPGRETHEMAGVRLISEQLGEGTARDVCNCPFGKLSPRLNERFLASVLHVPVARCVQPCHNPVASSPEPYVRAVAVDEQGSTLSQKAGSVAGIGDVSISSFLSNSHREARRSSTRYGTEAKWVIAPRVWLGRCIQLGTAQLNTGVKNGTKRAESQA